MNTVSLYTYLIRWSLSLSVYVYACVPVCLHAHAPFLSDSCRHILYVYIVPICPHALHPRYMHTHCVCIYCTYILLCPSSQTHIDTLSMYVLCLHTHVPFLFDTCRHIWYVYIHQARTHSLYIYVWYVYIHPVYTHSLFIYVWYLYVHPVHTHSLYIYTFGMYIYTQYVLYCQCARLFFV